MKNNNSDIREQETVQPGKKAKKAASAWGLIGKCVTAAVVLLVLFWFGFVCEVREGSCAVIQRFGAVRAEITESGVYLKLPWPFENVVTYDSRLQYLETNNLETTTSDKRNIILQSYVVWQVEDPLLYHNSVGSQGNANSYINSQVSSATNSILGSYKLTDLVSLEREALRIDQIQQEIFQRVQKTCAENYGIAVSDVSILRLSLPETNLNSVFSQMKADRQKEIDEILANAQLEYTQITTKGDQDAAEIIANGTTEAANIKAEAEKEVAKIYAEAQAANLELYQFLMNLDNMIASVNDKTILVVKANEYPFNVLTEYSKHMTVEGNATVINDLSYILGQLPEKDRTALIDAVSALIDQAADNNGITDGE